MRSLPLLFASVATGLFLIGACSGLDGLADAPDFEVIDSSPRDGGHGSIGDGDPTFTDGNIVCDDSSLTGCGTECVDLKTEPRHCGRCGHDCVGGACVGGVCQAVELATGIKNPQGIAADDTSLYVAVSQEDKIIRVAKDKPGTPEVVTTATDNPWSVALQLDENGKAVRLVWGETYASTPKVHVCSLPACSSTTSVTASAGVYRIVVEGTTAYWTEEAKTTGKVRKCDVTKCSSTAADVVTNENNPYGLAVAGGKVFFSQYASPGPVRSAPLAGGAAEDFMTGISSTVGLAADDKNVYAAHSDGNAGVSVCPLSGCTGEAPLFGASRNPHYVAVDVENVYFNNGLADGGSVVWCPKSGCTGGVKTLADKQNNPFSIAADDSAVYWTNYSPKGAVMKIARP